MGQTPPPRCFSAIHGIFQHMGSIRSQEVLCWHKSKCVWYAGRTTRSARCSLAHWWVDVARIHPTTPARHEIPSGLCQHAIQNLIAFMLCQNSTCDVNEMHMEYMYACDHNEQSFGVFWATWTLHMTLLERPDIFVYSEVHYERYYQSNPRLLIECTAQY